MHRETTISREIKLLKNKFELLEKNRQFRSILQKSGTSRSSIVGDTSISGFDDVNLGLDSNEFKTTSSTRTRNSETTTNGSIQLKKGTIEESGDLVKGSSQLEKQKKRKRSIKGAHLLGFRLNPISGFITKLFRFSSNSNSNYNSSSSGNKLRKKSNRVSSIQSADINQLNSSQVIATSTDDDEKLNSDDQQVESSSNVDGSTAVNSNKIAKTTKRGDIFGRLFKR